jgi:uncharacterized repeat protein (TIGR01451 family)
MRRLFTVAVFAAVLLGGSAAALVTRSAPQPTPPPVEKMLTDTLGKPPQSPPSGSGQQPPAASSQPAPKPQAGPKAPAPAGPAQPAAPKRAAASGPARLGPLQASGGNPLGSLAGIAGAYGGYATGSVAHADVLQNAGTRLADVEVAFSGAAYTSAALASAHNEVSRVVTPALAATNGYGRGSGLEVGLAVTPSGENQIVLPGKVEAKAPPITTLVTQEVGPVNLDPLALARLLRAQAQGRAVSNGCVIGSDLGYGLGYAADLGLLDTAPNGGTPGLDRPLLSSTAVSPDRAVSQSASRTFLVRGQPGRFGLTSETRQTIAPVTLLKGTPNQFTIEAAGEWALRVTADGATGSFFYGPGSVSPETPVVRVIDAAGKVTNVLTLQQLLDKDGLTVTIPGVAEIVIGEAPRALGGPTGSTPGISGTSASAAVDVARVKLLEQGQNHVGDVRVGHMEAAVVVPAGGIGCPIGMAKAANPSSVTAGNPFTWTVTVSNPHECVLTNVKVVDTVTTSSTQMGYSFGAQVPPANTVAGGVLTWNDIGPIAPGQSKVLTINVTVNRDSGGGIFTDKAVAEGVCGPGSAQAAAAASALSGEIVLNEPTVTPGGEVQGIVLRPQGTLPKTGGTAGPLPALAVLALSGLLRGLSRRSARSPLE